MKAYTPTKCHRCRGPAKQYDLPLGLLTTCAACADPLKLERAIAADPNGPLSEYMRALLVEASTARAIGRG